MSKTPINALRVRGATTGDLLVCVNDRGDFVPTAPTGEILVEDGSMEFLFDDATGDVLHEG